MPETYVLSSDATQDIERVVQWIRRHDGLAQAERFSFWIADIFDGLARVPFASGRVLAKPIRSAARVYIARPYLVVYTPGPPIVIAGVIDGRRRPSAVARLVARRARAAGS